MQSMTAAGWTTSIRTVGGRCAGRNVTSSCRAAHGGRWRGACGLGNSDSRNLGEIFGAILDWTFLLQDNTGSDPEIT
jgi:hypothetical protein